MTGNHFQLITLGRLAIVAPPGGDDAGLDRQRRKLAVLAVLALACAPLSRDTLVEMFWGDEEEARARHSLSDALSHLRRVLGREAITTRRADVALAAEVPLAVDARELREAATRGDDLRVLELYAGPFLDAVYVGGSPAFEQWVERERRALERLFHAASERRCEALLAEESWAECAAVAGRWLDSDPLSMDAALTLLLALRGDGSREGGLRALRRWEALRARLVREMGVEPDPAVSALAERIRAEIGVAESPPPDPAPAALPERADEPESLTLPPAPRTLPDAETIVTTGPRPRPRGRGRWRARRAPMAAAVALGAILLIGALLASGRREAVETAAGGAAVAVFPFAVYGAEEFAYLEEGMVDLLSNNLDGVAGLRTLDPRAVLGASSAAGAGRPDAQRGARLAEALGAEHYVVGTVVEAGGHLRITATLHRGAAGAPPVRAYAEGEADRLFSLVDALTTRLVADRLQRMGGRVVGTAALTTPSIEALKSYLEGERHWRALRLIDAVDALRRATAHDSTFALAWYRLGMASSWEGRVEVAEEAMDRAARHGTRLAERDRSLILAYRDIVARDLPSAERRYRAVIADYPADVEAWSGLGEVWFHANAWRGGSMTESRPAWESVLRLEPNNVGAAWHLAYVAARQGRAAELDSLLSHIGPTVSGDAALSVRAIRAAALGGRQDRAALIPALRDADDFSVVLALWRAAVATEDLGATLELSEPLTDRSRPREVRAVGHALRAQLRLGRGEIRRARAELDVLERLDPVGGRELRALLLAHPLLPARRADLERARAAILEEEARPGERLLSPADLWVNVHADAHPTLRLYLAGLLSARLGDAPATRRFAAELAAAGETTDVGHLRRSLARGVEAHLRWEQGDPAGALRVLESGPDVVDFGTARVSPFFARSRERFMRAELLRQTGREEEALGWYQGLAEVYPPDAPYLAPSHLMRAAILARRGDHEGAADHLARFLHLYRDADPELHPLVDGARRDLARLRTSAGRAPAP